MPRPRRVKQAHQEQERAALENAILTAIYLIESPTQSSEEGLQVLKNAAEVEGRLRTC